MHPTLIGWAAARWEAWEEEPDIGTLIGYGPTPEAAVADLMEQLDEERA